MRALSPGTRHAARTPISCAAGLLSLTLLCPALHAPLRPTALLASSLTLGAPCSSSIPARKLAAEHPCVARLGTPCCPASPHAPPSPAAHARSSLSRPPACPFTSPRAPLAYRTRAHLRPIPALVRSDAVASPRDHPISISGLPVRDHQRPSSSRALSSSHPTSPFPSFPPPATCHLHTHRTALRRGQCRT